MGTGVGERDPVRFGVFQFHNIVAVHTATRPVVSNWANLPMTLDLTGIPLSFFRTDSLNSSICPYRPSPLSNRASLRPS